MSSHGDKTVLVELELGSTHDVELHDLSASVSGDCCRLKRLFLGDAVVSCWSQNP